MHEYFKKLILYWYNSVFMNFIEFLQFFIRKCLKNLNFHFISRSFFPVWLLPRSSFRFRSPLIKKNHLEASLKLFPHFFGIFKYRYMDFPGFLIVFQKKLIDLYQPIFYRRDKRELELLINRKWEHCMIYNSRNDLMVYQEHIEQLQIK